MPSSSTNSARTYPLHLIRNHLFAELDDELWLIDTGSPSSFGDKGQLDFVGDSISISSSTMGLNAETLRKETGTQCIGLIGGNILNNYDIYFNLPQGTMGVSKEALDISDFLPNKDVPAPVPIPISFMLGVPVVNCAINGKVVPLFFDTGAQISYWQNEELKNFPPLEIFSDFYPLYGKFETQTYEISFTLGTVNFTAPFGKLPALLGMSLSLGGAQGILGNSVFCHCRSETTCLLPT